MVQPTISPAAAADAGCTAEITVDSHGAYPMPDADVGHDIVTGSYTKYAYSAAPVAGWMFLHFEVTYDERHSWRDVPTGTSGADTRTITGETASGTRPWTWYDAIGRSRNPCVEDSLHWEYVDDGGMLYYIDESSRIIKSVVAVFVRDSLPSGPILCNRSGVLVCNRSGNLLWH